MNRAVTTGKPPPVFCAPWLAAATALGLLVSATMAAETRPPPGLIAYAPDVVGVERIFMIALHAPVTAPDVAVSTPAAVTLFDRTRPPFKDAVRRFYFRAEQAASPAEIRFALPGDEVIVPVEVWSFEDLRRFRTLEGQALPRRWPLGQPLPELKRRQVIPTAATAAALQARPGGPGSYPLRSDDEIWAMQPDTTIPRTHYPNLPAGCPVHGTEVYKVRAFYPWEKDRSFPWKWKMRCPIGGEEYPSNDFAAGDMTSGDTADDGLSGGYRQGDQQYCFIADLAQEYSLQMLEVPASSALAYLATGDARHAHQALVALCRLAVEYGYLATMTHHRHHNSKAHVRRFGQGQFSSGPALKMSGFIYPCYKEAGALARTVEAYDRIFPAIDQDPKIIPFLRARGFAVTTHEDVRRFIEENLFAVWIQGVMDGSTDHANPGETVDHRGLARAIELLGYGSRTEPMGWLYDGPVGLRALITNGYFRDGAPPEALAGYNGNHVRSIAPLIDSIENIRRAHPELYPTDKYPPPGTSRRYRSIYDFAMNTVLIDRTYPSIGDDGGMPAYRPQPRTTWQNGRDLTAAFEHAYRLFRTPKLAWALARHPGWQPSADFPVSRAEVEREAARWPDDWNDRSSLHDGYGVAIARGGTAEEKRALWLRTGGQSRAHYHEDVMDLGFDAFQGKLLAHLGYPRNETHWDTSWITHNLARQIPFLSMAAQAQFVADAGPLHVTEARAQSFISEIESGRGYILPPDEWQRRLVALVDVSANTFYGVDFYRVSGGTEHWWSFHAQEGEFTTQGLRLEPQQGGTLAGPDIPYGDAAWLAAHGARRLASGWRGPMFGFAHLYNVQRGKLAVGGGGWSADWKLKGGDGLHLRLTVPEAGGADLAICDGTSPAGGKPYEMKWLMLHKQGEAPVRTQIVSILEPYKITPLIKHARSLPVSGDDEGSFAAVGCVLQLANRTDTLLFSARPEVRRTAGEVKFAGRFALVAEDSDGIQSMSLVGGTQLEKNGMALRLEHPAYRARIVRVERDTDTLTVASAPPDLKAIISAQVFITSAGRRSAYRVIAAKRVSAGAELQLDLDSRIGTGRVTGLEDHRVLTTSPFWLQGYRYYDGARLVNAARTAEYKIHEVLNRKGAYIDAKAHPAATRSRLAGEFRTGEWFDVYDYGVGDEVEWPFGVSLTRVSPGLYRLSAPAPVQVSLPAGSRLAAE